ncbi:hypothetical protein VTO42DRAFT_756 [Malbranchea cinnamomea]
MRLALAVWLLPITMVLAVPLEDSEYLNASFSRVVDKYACLRDNRPCRIHSECCSFACLTFRCVHTKRSDSYH